MVGGAAEEKITQQPDRVGDVHVAVGVEVAEFDIGRMGRRAITAGQRNGGVDEKGNEETRRVGDVDRAVAIAVAGDLPASI